MWIQPVYDRTEQNKGYCNYSDLNRLEGNCCELAWVLGVSITTKAWTRLDMPKVAEFTRIKANIQLLRDAYYTPTVTPVTPNNPINDYIKWNAVEKILSDIHDLYNRNINALLYTGEVYAGQEIGVI